jgi:hypothetical protein
LIVIKKSIGETKMCHVSSGKPGSQQNSFCGCGCACPAALMIEDEIRSLEDHRKILQDQLEVIDKKITALKSVDNS